jgi:hypothetical protein
MITIYALLPHHHHQPRHLNHHKVCHPTLKIGFANPTACSDNYDYSCGARQSANMTSSTQQDTNPLAAGIL